MRYEVCLDIHPKSLHFITGPAAGAFLQVGAFCNQSWLRRLKLEVKNREIRAGHLAQLCNLWGSARSIAAAAYYRPFTGTTFRCSGSTVAEAKLDEEHNVD